MVCGRVIIIHGGKLVFEETLANIAAGPDGKSKVVVELSGPGEAVQSALSRLSDVTAVRWDGRQPVGGYEISAAPGRDVREAVYHCAVKNNWVLRELRTQAPSLEDIFVQLTAKD